MRYGEAGRKRVVRDFVAGATVLLVTACGGGDEPGPTTSRDVAALTKVEFLAEADRVCTSSESQIEAAADEFATQRGGPDPAEVERVALRVAVPALESEVRAIDSLGAPPGDERRVKEILDATRRGIVQIKADPRALADGPPPALREAQRLASAYGSRECGFR